MTIRRVSPSVMTSDPGDVIDFGGVFAKAAITVGAKVANVRTITIQLQSSQSAALLAKVAFEVGMFADAGAAAFAVTGGSTGLAAGATGAVLPIVAKKLFKVVTDAAGLAVLQYTDTGSEAVFLGVMLRNGQIAMSSALA